jgi:transposase
MKLSQTYKKTLLSLVQETFPTQRRGRPRVLDPQDALDSLFRLIRTGMQWRELVPQTASYITVFKHTHRWAIAGLFEKAYTRCLQAYSATHPARRYELDTSFVKNQYGRASGLGRNPTDRGRSALKLAAVVDHNGVVVGASTFPANKPDVTLFAATLSEMLISIRRIELFTDRGFDSRKNRRHAQRLGLTDRIARRGSPVHRRLPIEHTFAWIDKYRRLLHVFEHSVQKYLQYTFVAIGHLLSTRFLSSESRLSE